LLPSSLVDKPNLNSLADRKSRFGYSIEANADIFRIKQPVDLASTQ